MTAADMICLIADGLRAGTIRMDHGTASVSDVCPQYLSYIDLDGLPPAVPVMFKFECDGDFSQTGKKVPAARMTPTKKKP